MGRWDWKLAVYTCADNVPVHTSHATSKIPEKVRKQNGETAYVPRLVPRNGLMRLRLNEETLVAAVVAGAVLVRDMAVLVHAPYGVQAFTVPRPVQRLRRDALGGDGFPLVVRISRPLEGSVQGWVIGDCSPVVSFSAGVKELKPLTFLDCRGLLEVRFAADCKISALPEQCFSGCDLRCFRVPRQVRELHKNTFYKNSFLQGVEVTEGSQLKALRPLSIVECQKFTAVYVPEGGKVDTSQFDGTGVAVIKIKSGDYRVLDLPLREWRALRDVRLPEGI